MDSSDRLKHPEDWVGERLHGKWRIDELLGLGGVASVYAATDRHGQRVAIKLMHGYWVDEPSVCERFLREGYSANRVKHPAVISAFADGITEGGTPFLVLELLEGRSLEAELLIHGKMPAQRVLAIADQVLDALAAAHDIGVLHRDLKPDNLFLMHDDTVRLLDFGIARMHDPDSMRLTQEGRAMGTPGFMAPEQARGEWDRVDARCDVWSVGASMFALLTGREPFEARTQQELLIISMTRAPEPVREVDPSIDPRVAAIIDKALTFEPEGRWPDARAMQHAVREALQQLAAERSSDPVASLRPVTSDPQPGATRPAARARRTRWGSLLRQALIVTACGASIAAVATDLHDRAASGLAVHTLAPLIAEVSEQAAGAAAIEVIDLDQ